LALPSFQQLMAPTLAVLAKHVNGMHVALIEDEIAALLELASADLARLLPSGTQSVFANRLNWARSYLSKALLVETPRRGLCRITERGRELLNSGVKEIDLGVLNRFPEFVVWREQQRSEDRPGDSAPRGGPEELIAANYEFLNVELARELIERVHVSTPSFFERLIIDLLLRMGYGGGRIEMGKTLGRTGDGGVDGVIREDELGLDVVYVQAKRFHPEKGVPVREVRDFVGGLEGHRASKGVFVTTSFFPTTALDFITRVSKRVVLIDGPELARLMIRHGVGARTKAAYEIKRIDEDYFAA
jgi:restriction system protein